MYKPQTRIVLVEDDEADIVHFKRLFRKSGIDAELTVATSGEAALKILRNDCRCDINRSLIVTDINMPGLTGHELIEEVRSDAELATSVIFVVSTSDLDEDIEKAYEQHVAGYIVKDETGERLEAGIAMLQHYVEAVSLR